MHLHPHRWWERSLPWPEAWPWVALAEARTTENPSGWNEGGSLRGMFRLQKYSIKMPWLPRVGVAWYLEDSRQWSLIWRGDLGAGSPWGPKNLSMSHYRPLVLSDPQKPRFHQACKASSYGHLCEIFPDLHFFRCVEVLDLSLESVALPAQIWCYSKGLRSPLAIWYASSGPSGALHVRGGLALLERTKQILYALSVHAGVSRQDRAQSWVVIWPDRSQEAHFWIHLWVLYNVSLFLLN